MHDFYPYLTSWLEGRLETVWRQEQTRLLEATAQPGPVRAGELAAAVVALAIGLEDQHLERQTRLLALAVGNAQGSNEVFTLYDLLQEEGMPSYKGLLQNWSGSRTLLVDMQEAEVRQIATERAGVPLSIVVVISLTIEVIDESILRATLKERPPHRAPAGQTVDYLVAEALLYASNNPQPEVYGITLHPQECFIGWKGSQVLITQAIQVDDEVRLWQYALTRYRACWGHEMAEEKEPGDLTLQNAVLEALVLSNDGPMPIDYGFEIAEFRAWLSPGAKPRPYVEIVAALAKDASSNVRSLQEDV